MVSRCGATTTDDMHEGSNIKRPNTQKRTAEMLSVLNPDVISYYTHRGELPIASLHRTWVPVAPLLTSPKAL